MGTCKFTKQINAGDSASKCVRFVNKWLIKLIIDLGLFFLGDFH